jgi:hypothetical protein
MHQVIINHLIFALDFEKKFGYRMKVVCDSSFQREHPSFVCVLVMVGWLFNY